MILQVVAHPARPTSLVPQGIMTLKTRKQFLTANRSLRRRRSQEENRASRPKRKMILKPVAPAKYNGEPNSELFLTFMDDANAYLREGGVPRRKEYAKLGHSSLGKHNSFTEVRYEMRPAIGV